MDWIYVRDKGYIRSYSDVKAPNNFNIRSKLKVRIYGNIENRNATIFE